MALIIEASSACHRCTRLSALSSASRRLFDDEALIRGHAAITAIGASDNRAIRRYDTLQFYHFHRRMLRKWRHESQKSPHGPSWRPALFEVCAYYRRAAEVSLVMVSWRRLMLTCVALGKYDRPNTRSRLQPQSVMTGRHDGIHTIFGKNGDRPMLISV